MSIRDRLLDAWDILGGQAPRSRKGLTINLAPGGFVNEVSSTIIMPSGRYSGLGASGASTDELQLLMALNELVFACVGVKASSARDPRLLVQRQVKKGDALEYEEIAGHPFRQLIMRPNPRMTEGDLMRAAIVSWDVSNPRRFYCEKVYRSGLLVELWPLNPCQMTPRYSADRSEVLGYTWSDGRKRKEYTNDELLIRSAPAWYDPPPLVAALGSAEADSAQTEFISAFFEGGGVPPLFLKYHNTALNDTQRDQIRDKYMAVHGGIGRSGVPGILDMNSDVQIVGSRLDQLSSQTLRSIAESRICMVFGVPPLIVYAYVGLLRATYANLKEAWAGFWDATMSPLFKEWRDFWTWNLLTEFEEERDIRSERVRLNYDMSQVAALQDDVDAIAARARSDFQARITDLNEARAARGLPPKAGGENVYYGPGAAPAAAPKATIHSNGNGVHEVEV